MILKPKNKLLTKNKHFERVFESDHPKFTMNHAIQLCSGIIPIVQNTPRPIFQQQPRPVGRVLQRPTSRFDRERRRTLEIPRIFPMSFSFDSPRLYNQIMTPSDTESDTDTESEIEIFITRENLPRTIMFDNSQNQMEIDEEIIRRNIEQLLRDDSEFEELQREDYDSES
jgi:hypothetical protein